MSAFVTFSGAALRYFNWTVSLKIFSAEQIICARAATKRIIFFAALKSIITCAAIDKNIFSAIGDEVRIFTADYESIFVIARRKIKFITTAIDWNFFV